MKWGLVTCEKLPRLHEDDLALVNALADRGIDSAPVVWTAGPPKKGEFGALLLRSTWDYHLRLPEFLRWLDLSERATPVYHPSPLVRWNCHKSYLLDLRARGVPVIPTFLGSGVRSLDQLMDAEGWPKAVIKPAVSADSYKTYLVARSEAKERGERLLHELLALGEVLVQPYLPSVEVQGERSLVHFGGKFSHAVLKRAYFADGAPVTEGTPVDPSPEELRVAQRAVQAAPLPTLYARADLVFDPQGTPRLMELELIEPSLFFAADPKAAGRFASAIAELDRSLG